MPGIGIKKNRKYTYSTTCKNSYFWEQSKGIIALKVQKLEDKYGVYGAGTVS